MTQTLADFLEFGESDEDDDFTITPVSLAHPLLDFQKDALEHVLRGPSHSYLALEMGLGKTVVAIAAIAAAHNAGVQRSLVVCPPSLLINWNNEFQKFAPWLRVAPLRGTTPRPLPDADVYLIGDSVIGKWEEQLSSSDIGVLVVDEAHRHKNHKAQRSRALAGVSSTVSNLRVLMSGTPAPNGRHVELPSQFEVLGGDAWRDVGGKGLFWSMFAPKQSMYGRVNANGDELHRRLTDSFMLRMLRSDVIELPNKGRTSLLMEASGKAARDYISAESDLIEWLRGEGIDTRGASRAEALVQLNVLRRLAGVSKVASVASHVEDLLADAEEGGVFVVAEHNEVMDKLLIKLAKYNPVAVRGGMSPIAKDNAVQAFCSGESRVLVGQITAAGVGLTLHGGGRNTRVVVAQLPWTPAELKQAEDRLHRIGQTNDVMVEIGLAHIEDRWTIDERLWSALEMKNFDTTSLMDGEGEFLLDGVIEGVLDTYR